MYADLWKMLKGMGPWFILYVLLPTLLYILSVVVVQTADWWMNGRRGPWWDAIQSVAYYWWISLPLLWLFSIMAYNAFLTEKSVSKISELNEKLDEAKKIGLETVGVCINFLNKTLNETVLNPQDWIGFAAANPDRVRECIKSLGANLRAWSDHISKHRRNEQGHPSYLTNTWLTYLETYFREEAFDVRRRELVTNGSNYPFLLVATLSTLLQQLPAGYYLHYYVVTPVNPKDWYNWPHGRLKPKCYYEADFLSLFHRSLQEFLEWTRRNGNKLIHARFVLTADDNVPSGAFGWELDSFKNLREDLENCLVINISAAITEYPKDPFWNALSSYYRKLVGTLVVDPSVTRVVPLIGKHWVRRLERNSDGTNASRIEDLKQWVLQINSKYNTYVDPLSNAKKAAETAMEKCLKTCPRDISEKMRNLVTDSKSSKAFNFPSFVRDLHQISLDLAQTATGTEDPIRKIFLEILRYRAAAHHNSARAQFSPLGEVFAKQLHSDPRNAFVVSLTNSPQRTNNAFGIDHWTKSSLTEGVEPEFAIFGVCDKPECSPETFDNIVWKLALATDINYPFEAAKIRIIDDDQTITRYKTTVSELLSGLNTDPPQTWRMVNLVQGGKDTT